MGSDQPRRRSLVDKLLHRNSPTPDNQTHTTHDPETQDTTGLLQQPPAATRTITFPLEGGGTETLTIPNDQKPADALNATPNAWKYRHGTRKASVPASDTGENTTASSDVEKAQFANLMRQTKGMTPEEVKEFLAKRGGIDGGKVMRRWQEGKTGEGYQQVVGPDTGTM